ncbi:Zn-dependent hydrolase YycJ/WalJ [Clostridiaceae bacterium JG1575]|nr:Zn-dependent hydrolase YycJ/WalJ [Clostridiaceae bacterium JG1575]
MKFSSLYSGSSGNSLFVSSKDSSVLIDAGLTGKSILSAMEAIGEEPSRLMGIFITHEHSDHIKGAGILSRKFNLPIFANEATWLAMERSLGKIAPHNVRVMDKEIVLGDLAVRSFRVPHDAAACVGYTVEDAKGRLFSSVTDMGVFTREIHEGIKDSQVILMESNHDVQMLKYGPYPYDLKLRVLSELGHLSNEDCAKALLTLGAPHPRTIVLGHLSGTNNVPELALQTVQSILKEAGVVLGEGAQIDLKVASRIRPSAYTDF